MRYLCGSGLRRLPLRLLPMSARKSTRTRELTLCAIISALCVLVLLLGSFLDVLDLTAAMLASVFCTVVVIEVGKLWPWLTYATVSVLSLVLLPNKLPAAVFLLTGYYPIIKQKLERLKKPVAWILKIIIFNVICTAFFFMCSLFFVGVDLMLIPSVGKTANIVLGYAVGNAVFVLYDIALSKIIIYYVFSLSDRLRIRKK